MSSPLLLMRAWSHIPGAFATAPDLPLDLSLKNAPETKGFGQKNDNKNDFCHSRLQRRKEQNKAAAQSYRQRKKSLSEYIELEHKALLMLNHRLRMQRERLETQLRRMRQIVQNKNNNEFDRKVLKIRVWADNNRRDGSIQSCRERKKEQNKLASRRFRQRRKFEQDCCERQATLLQARNQVLKKGLLQLEQKVAVMRSCVQNLRLNSTIVP